MYLYLFVAEEVVSVFLISEFDTYQIPEDRNGSLGVITTSPKLRRYFLTHFIVVQTYMTLKQVFYLPNLVGCLNKWVVELFEFEVSFEARKALKTRFFYDFLAQITPVPI